MEASFWHQIWEEQQIPFHESGGNALFIEHFSALNLPQGSRVFLPLCGKTLDIGWLLAQGYKVVGIELSELAVQQLFEQLGVEPLVEDCGALKRYSAPNLDILLGDFFALTSAVLGPVDAIYDRASLVALPAEMRERYCKVLLDVCEQAPQLLICFEYDQALQPGPPFSISSDEIARHYAAHYTLDNRARLDVKGGLKGLCAASENLWLLQKA